MYFIGLNCFHANSSICLFKDEKLIFAIEEERLNRKKNWYGFPKESLAYILNKYNLGINLVSVDLPEPDCPTIATNCPASIFKFI